MGVTALSSCLLVPIAGAQVPQVAGASVVAAADAPDPMLFQAQSPQMSQRGPPTADAGESDDFLHRYKPQANLVEVGLFVGPLFISDNNSFRGPTVVSLPGLSPTVKPLTEFKQPAPEIGVRGGYYPLSFLGGELEGMIAVAESDANQAVTVLAGRVQAVVQLPYWSIVPFAVAGVGYWGVLNDESGDDSDPAFHFGVGGKLNVTHDLALRVDVRDSITNKRGNGDYPHNIEALAGANLVFGRTSALKDSDRDGVVDDSDQCPLEAGTLANGCPVRDSDSDGIMDPHDQCAMEAGMAPTGCPVRDADQDGVMDADDQCISEMGGAPTGCPDGDQDGFLDRADACPAVPGIAPDGCLQDADGDGFLGAADHCPDVPETRNGFEDGDGCADELPQAVKNFMGVIAGIEFDTGRAAIRASSAIVLDKAVSVLTEYPSLRIEITGHTDSTGTREHNLELSQQRAEAVRERLIAHGVEPSRIQSKGAGPDVPLTTNDSHAGRQKNRRIEFRVLE
jgi:outer membrane protein OmpA-like peptidoglycan-associated protein